MQKLFDAYWALADNNVQNQYLMGCITPRKVLRRRKTNSDKPDMNQWTYSVDADNIVVCRHTFKSIHGIKEGKLRIIMEMKKNSPENVALPDMRGKSKFGLIIM